MDKILQDQAAKFEETHPGSKVNVTLVPCSSLNRLTQPIIPTLSGLAATICLKASF